MQRQPTVFLFLPRHNYVSMISQHCDLHICFNYINYYITTARFFIKYFTVDVLALMLILEMWKISDILGELMT